MKHNDIKAFKIFVNNGYEYSSLEVLEPYTKNYQEQKKIETLINMYEMKKRN